MVTVSLWMGAVASPCSWGCSAAFGGGSTLGQAEVTTAHTGDLIEGGALWGAPSYRLRCHWRPQLSQRSLSNCFPGILLSSLSQTQWHGRPRPDKGVLLQSPKCRAVGGRELITLITWGRWGRQEPWDSVGSTLAVHWKGRAKPHTPPRAQDSNEDALRWQTTSPT